MADLSYRPLSGLAVAGFGLAVLYAPFVGLVAYSVWRSGRPLLLSWALVLGGGAFLVSWLGRRAVLRAEGLRAGLRLAGWGLALSGLLTITHIGIILGKEQAVRLETGPFAADWLEAIRQADVYTAFLLTVPATQRQGDSPDDLPRLRARYGVGRSGARGPLPLFLEHELVQIVRQGGSRTQIEALGPRNWTYTGGGYLVEQVFRITTPEGEYEAVLPVWGGNRRDLPGGDWHIVTNDQLTVRSLRQTPLGEVMAGLRLSAGRFVEAWGKKLADGQRIAAYLETCDPAQRHRRAAEFHARLAARALAPPEGTEVLTGGALADDRLASRLYLAGFSAFHAGDFIRTGSLLAADDATRKAARSSVAAVFQGSDRNSGFQLRVPSGRTLETCPWRLEKGELQLTLPVTFWLSARYHGEGTAALSTRDLPPLLESATPSPGPVPGGPRWWLRSLEMSAVLDLLRPAAAMPSTAPGLTGCRRRSEPLGLPTPCSSGHRRARRPRDWPAWLRPTTRSARSTSTPGKMIWTGRWERNDRKPACWPSGGIETTRP
jgi:hypothetical protein